MNLKTKAIAGVRWTGLSTLSTTVGQIVQLTVIARLLTPEDFGLFTMAAIVIGFAQTYADMGISAALIHRQDNTVQQLSSLYWLNIFAGISVFLLLVGITPLISLFYHEPRLSPILRVVALTFLITMWGTQFDILLQKDLSFNLLAKVQILTIITGVGASIFCALGGLGVWSLVWGQLVSSTVRTFLLVVLGRKYYKPKWHFATVDLRGYFLFGLYQLGERSINFLAERFDQLLLGSFVGAQALGYYNMAFRLVTQPISQINPIVTRVAFPVFARVQDDLPRLQRGYSQVLQYLTTINAPILCGLASVAPKAIPLIFGEQWSKSILLLQILTVPALLRSIGNPIGSLMLAKGRADLGFQWNIFLFIVSIPAISIGAILSGATGVAVSLLLLQIILQIPGYIYVIKPLLQMDVVAYLATIGHAVGFALCMGGCVWLLGVFTPVSWKILCLQIGLGGICYIGCFWLFHEEHQLSMLKHLLTK